MYWPRARSRSPRPSSTKTSAVLPHFNERHTRAGFFSSWRTGCFRKKAFAAASIVLDSANTFQAGPHGLSEVLYNFASASNNNGSAFAYQGTGTDWYTVTQGIAMLIGRFGLIIPALAIAGSLSAKPMVPTTSGTLPTHTPLFGALIAGVVVIVTGLTFFPALALGPIPAHQSI